MTIHWKAVEQFVCNFGKLINFGLGTFRSERVNVKKIIGIGCIGLDQ